MFTSEQAALPELVEQRTAQGLTLSWRTPAKLPCPMPVPVQINGVSKRLDFSQGPVTLPLQSNDKALIDPEMKVLRMLPIIGNCEEMKSGQTD